MTAHIHVRRVFIIQLHQLSVYMNTRTYLIAEREDIFTGQCQAVPDQVATLHTAIHVEYLLCICSGDAAMVPHLT